MSRQNRTLCNAMCSMLLLLLIAVMFVCACVPYWFFPFVCVYMYMMYAWSQECMSFLTWESLEHSHMCVKKYQHQQQYCHHHHTSFFQSVQLFIAYLFRILMQCLGLNAMLMFDNAVNSLFCFKLVCFSFEFTVYAAVLVQMYKTAMDIAHCIMQH